MKITLDDSVNFHPQAQPIAAAADNDGALAGREVAPIAAPFAALLAQPADPLSALLPALLTIYRVSIASLMDMNRQTAERNAPPAASTPHPLPPELDVIISSYIDPNSVIDYTDRDITDADLMDLRRYVPRLLTLDVTGSTYNGTRDFGWLEIRGEQGSPHGLLSITGAPTLDERIQWVERALETQMNMLLQIQQLDAQINFSIHNRNSGVASAPEAPSIDTEWTNMQLSVEALLTSVQFKVTQLQIRLQTLMIQKVMAQMSQLSVDVALRMRG